jgi:hypothetical protein
MRLAPPLQRSAAAAGLLLAAGFAAATWIGCGPTSGGLPGGTWGGAAGDTTPGGGDTQDDASTSGAMPTSGADAGVVPNATQDGGEATDAATRKGDGSAAPVDAAMDLDTGSPLTTFTLLDTNVNTIVDGEPVSGWDPIPESSTIDLAKVGTALSIRANTTPAIVSSVTFVLDGVTTHTELSAPYTECSDNGAGTITPCVYSLGKHTLVVTPYAATDGGDAGAMPSTTLYFTIVDSATDGGMDGAADAAKD